MTEILGSPYFIAPEVLKGNYTLTCDVWSLGIMMYVMLAGQYPFSGRNNQELFEKIKNGVFKMD